MKLSRVIQICKNVFSIKNGIKSFNISCTGSHKRLWIRYVLCLEMIGRVFLVELCFFQNIINTFQKSWKVLMHSVFLSDRPSVHALNLLNILEMSWNLHMLFISDIEWTVVKIVCMELRVRLLRHTKAFRYIKAY